MRGTLPFFGMLLALGAAALFLVMGSGSMTSASAASADAQYSTVADATVTLAAYGNARVCCKRGGRDWWSTARECRRVRGHQVANRECRDDRADTRVCCKRGRHDWWSTLRQCRRTGGHQVANRECRND